MFIKSTNKIYCGILRRCGIFCIGVLAAACSDEGERSTISGPDDFNGKILSCQLGTMYERELPNLYPDSKLFLTDGYIDPAVMVQRGKADVAFMSSFYWDTIKEDYPDLMDIESSLEPTDIAFAISKDNPELKAKINDFIEEYKTSQDSSRSTIFTPMSYDQAKAAEKKKHRGGSLKIAISASQEPFEYLQNGIYLGMEPDILRAFADKYDMDCEFIDMNFAALIPHITTGKADIAAGMISITQERANSVDFTIPWTEEKYVAVIKKTDYRGDNPLLIKDFNDMAGKKIAVMTGSLQDSYLSASGIDCEIIRVESVTDMYLALRLGKVDGLLTSCASFGIEQKEAPFAVCVCDTISPLPIGIAFNKNEDALREEFNSFLEKYKASDKFRQRCTEWNNDPNACDIDRTPYNITNGSISVAVSSILPPFCFMKNGKITGLEVEVLNEFARSSGRELKLVDMSFAAIIPYVNSGKSQIGACFMCITPERKQGVDFSNPWSFECTGLVTKSSVSEVQARRNNVLSTIKSSFYKNVIKEDRYMLLLQGLGMTILISLLSALFGTVFGAVLCLGYRSGTRALNKTCHLFVDFMRCMPQVVFLMIMFYIVLGKTDLGGPMVAIISFTLCFGAYTCVIFSSTADSLDKGQQEAAMAMGFTRFKTFRFFVLPQLVQKALPVYQNEFIGLVKATSIVGYIAVFDLTRAGDIIRSRTYEAFFPLIIVTILYFLIIWALSFLLKYAGLKTQPKRNTYHKQSAHHD